MLTAVSGRAQTFIHNGGTAGTTADFAEIEGADVTDAEVRGALSASNGIDFNASTGVFTADQGEIRGFFAAGTGLAYDANNGSFSLDVDICRRLSLIFHRCSCSRCSYCSCCRCSRCTIAY